MILQAGSLVKFTGLQAKPELNGSFAVVQQFHADKQRWEVVPSQVSGSGPTTLAVKESNLTQESIITPEDSKFSGDRKYMCAAFWPRVPSCDTIPIQSFDDWPAHEDDEIPYLKRRLKWRNPQIYGGLESQGVAKPDFMLYFDASDETSAKNDVAQKMINLLPGYEKSKLGPYAKQPLRGVCVLIYSPMVSTTTSYGLPPGMAPPPGTSTTSGNPNRRFSLEQLLGVLEFHESPAARAQYQSHDNPMHRMFGGMM